MDISGYAARARDISIPVNEKERRRFIDFSRTWSMATPQDMEKNAPMAILAYVLCFVPLFRANRQSQLIRYHSNQGLVLFICALLWGAAYTAIRAHVLAMSQELWQNMGGAIGLTSIAFLFYVIVGIINAANGRLKPLPLIGRIRLYV